MQYSMDSIKDTGSKWAESVSTKLPGFMQYSMDSIKDTGSKWAESVSTKLPGFMQYSMDSIKDTGRKWAESVSAKLPRFMQYSMDSIKDTGSKWAESVSTKLPGFMQYSMDSIKDTGRKWAESVSAKLPRFMQYSMDSIKDTGSKWAESVSTKLPGFMQYSMDSIKDTGRKWAESVSAKLPRFMQYFMDSIKDGRQRNESLSAKLAFNKPNVSVQKLLTNGQFESRLCFYSDTRSEKIYADSTIDINVKVDSSPSKVFVIKTSHNQFIIELKEIIQRHTGYRCDEQKLELLSYKDHNELILLKDGKKLGDYAYAIGGEYKLIVTKRVGNKPYQIHFHSKRER